MRLLFFALFALPCGLFAQATGGCGAPFEAAANPGHEVTMTLRSGDVTIVGIDGGVIRVTCAKGDRDIKISFAAGHLTIRGGQDRSVHFRIEIPRSMNLRIHCTAGDLSIAGIAGDKDVELEAVI